MITPSPAHAETLEAVMQTVRGQNQAQLERERREGRSFGDRLP